MKFHEKVRAWLAAKGLNQSALIDMTGINKSWISDLVNYDNKVAELRAKGRTHNPVLDVYRCATIAKAIGVSLDYMVDENQGCPPLEPGRANNQDAVIVREPWEQLLLERARELGKHKALGLIYADQPNLPLNYERVMPPPTVAAPQERKGSGKAGGGPRG